MCRAVAKRCGKQMGKAKKADRFRGGLESLGTGPMTAGQDSKQFDRIELAAKVFAPPPVKFKDLESFISKHNLHQRSDLPVRRAHRLHQGDREHGAGAGHAADQESSDITFMTKDGVSKGVVNILGKVTTITHKPVQTFEDTVEVTQPAELLEKTLEKQSIYWKALPLRPGAYRVDIAIKDVNNPDHVGPFRHRASTCRSTMTRSWPRLR